MSEPAPSGAAIRRLLHRRGLASDRHRTAVGRRLGLRPSELAALNLLAEHGRLTPSELGAHLMLTSGGVTALVQRLERLGFVRRTPHPQDGRSWVLRADPAAIAAIGELNAPLVAALDAAVAELAVAERRCVARFLERVDARTEEAADRLFADHDATEAEAAAGDPALWT